MINSENGDETEALIPYYISDGATNDLRANLILPFVCINENDKTRCSCFYSPSTKGLKYKYNICNNLNFEHVYNTYYPIKDPIEDRIKYSKTDITGLGSVLPRITNLLDFIIAISSSDKIDNKSNIYNLLSFRPLKEKQIEWNYDDDVISIEPSSKKLTIEDNFREFLVGYLTFFKNKIKPLISTEQCYVIINKIDIKNFNSIYPICENNQVTPDSQLNFVKYIRISIKFFEEFKRKIDISSQHTNIKAILKTNHFCKDEFDKEGQLSEHISIGFNGATCNPDSISQVESKVSDEDGSDKPLLMNESKVSGEAGVPSSVKPLVINESKVSDIPLPLQLSTEGKVYMKPSLTGSIKLEDIPLPLPLKVSSDGKVYFKRPKKRKLGD
jgi:hypothetical protein